MNSQFERRIREYSGIIDENEPASGHRERFAAKLATRKKTNRRWKIMLNLTATAAMIAGIVFVMYAVQPETKNSDSLAEVQHYYAMQFENKVSEIETLLEHMDKENRTAVLNDIENMKAETIRTLQTTDEENIPFIVNMYSSKIEALEHIQYILQ